METLLNPETREKSEDTTLGLCITPDNMNTRPSILKITNTARA